MILLILFLLLAMVAIVIVAVVLALTLGNSRRNQVSAPSQARVGQAVPVPPVNPEQILLTEEQKTEITELVRSGRQIEAIKRTREITGVGLKEAKHFVDSL